MKTDLDELSINTLRFLSVDAVQKADSGHPGLPLGAAPMAYALWTRFLRHNPANPRWFDRDRFVLSAGHGSMLLYSLLHLTGYDLPMEQLKRFRQWGSLTPGHPERGLTPGVEASTGPLGQGFGNGVGMAAAEAHLAARYNRPGFEIIDHFTYALVSDGDLMEGVASEAASLAGHLKLGKLIYLYDDNRVTLSGSTDLSFTEDRLRRFAAYGWHTRSVEDGNDLKAVERAIAAAREETGRPSLIRVRTHIGYGSPHMQDTFKAHGSPLGEEEVRLAKQKLGWPVEPSFLVPKKAAEHFRAAVDRGRRAEARWRAAFSAYEKKHPEPAGELRRLIGGALPPDWDGSIPGFPADPKGLATRAASGQVLAAIAPKLPELIGGSGDLNASTNTALKGAGDFESPARAAGDRQGSAGGVRGFAGRNLHFGVREHAMGAVANGLALHGGVLPFAATFLTFSDYMRPSIRLAALMGARVVYVFTHDSIGLGEDGPTHQSVEHLAALRAIPNLTVLRPGDANETAAAWRAAIETRNRPVALVLSRQSMPTLDRGQFAPADGLRRGAYVLSEPPSGRPRLILIASGSEVGLIAAAGQRLRERKIDARLVSMPSWELFEAQSREYRDSVLPPGIRARLAVEAGSAQGWHKYVGERGDVIGVDRFGASAPGEVVLREYGFSVDNVCERALALLNDHGGEKIMKPNPLRTLETFGQSLWLDFISRELIGGGELKRLIERDDLKGMTSNPALFEKAIADGRDYRAEIRALARSRASAMAIYEALSLSDVRRAADEFRGVYDRTGGADGFVSLEVNPHLARDTQGTIKEARRLWRALDRPNVMIKVPATAQGLPAIEQLTGEGVNVNVTLLFGLPRYREVAQAYCAGIAARVALRKPVGRVASVASFFLSRIDAMVDPLLENVIARGGPRAATARKALGQTAIASAKQAFGIYKEIFERRPFLSAAEEGARVQRLLWASTGVKNPRYPEVKYVDALIGPHTVNSAPLKTIDAYREHGDPKARLEEGLEKASAVLESLARLGIGLDGVTQRLEDEGIEKFNEPFDKLLGLLEKERAGAPRPGPRTRARKAIRRGASARRRGSGRAGARERARA